MELKEADMDSRALLPVLTITISAAITLTACGNNEKEVSFKSGGMTHTFAEGNSANTESFPLPIYPNAEPSGSVNAKGEGDEHAAFMMLSSADELTKVSDFYAQKLKEDGWTLNATTTMPKMVNISASKKELEANVMLGRDSEKDKTTITLAVSKEPDVMPTITGNENYTPDKLNPPTD